MDESVIISEDDPNFFCVACKKKMKDRRNYRLHLQKVHKMILKPVKFMTRADPNIEPDVNDPNFFCKSCNHKFAGRVEFRHHLRFKHEIQLLPLVKKPKFVPNIKVVDISDRKNTYCVVCKKTYSTPSDYKRHLQKHEKSGPGPLVGKSKVNPNITPDVNDSNNHCSLCDTFYINRSNYLRHLRDDMEILLSWSTPKRLIQNLADTASTVT